MNDLFHKIAVKVSNAAGSSIGFITAILVIILWAISGPFFKYSDSWQLVINTGTTIVTFLMVFLIQNTQNRDSKALHLKLDELLKGVKGARDAFVNLEEMSDAELEKIHQEFEALRIKSASELSRRGKKPSQ